MDRIIQLSEIINKYNDYAKSGSIVYEISKDIISNGGIVIIDMKGIESVPTNFMNTSFGALITNCGFDKTKQSFKFRNILKSQLSRFAKYFADYQKILEETN